MANTAFKGNPVHTNGDLPAVGGKAPDFKLTSTALAEVTLSSYAGKKKILTINPSLDTGVCQATVRNFNKRAADIADAVVLSISSDLPFAAKRFCTTEGIEKVVPLSVMRDRKFAKDYGLLQTDGPLAGLVARAVIVLDANDKVLYAQLVPEITTEPDYDAALAAAKG